MRTMMAGLLLLALMGCQASVGKIQFAYGPAAPLDGFDQNYQWAELERPEHEDPRLSRPDLHQLIREQVNKNLASKGYVEGNPPAFHVTYDVSTQYRVARPGWTPVAYEEGALIVYLVHPETDQLMWNGSVQVEIDTELDPEARRTRIIQGVEQLLANLPDHDG